MDLHDFFLGKSFDAYTYFGAHPLENGWVFRVYAPCCKEVYLIGDFNHWQPAKMSQIDLTGIYEIIISEGQNFDCYKYRIVQKDGKVLDRSDPYGYMSELRPHNASRLINLNHYVFHDTSYQHQPKPLNIYELHLGSWLRNKEGQWLNYRDLVEPLISYVKEMGYTHIEIMPLQEHPSDDSWGYQVSNFYAITSRYGNVYDFMYLVDRLHQENIGVILDVVVVHFAVNDFALFKFDGTALYEFDHHDIGYSEWGSYNFNYYRKEVCSFMQSSIAFLIETYHLDGVRMDAINNLIYWQGDRSRGINEGAIDFIQTMNKGLHEKYHDVLLIAEDSSNYLNVTHHKGLDFDYKWDLGWMNDTLKWFSLHPEQRVQNFNLLTFSMHYFYNEKYLLVLSHDEVVHGKKTILDKMYGDYAEKFRQVKMLYLYMMSHPGGKLNFMGNEIGHFREWDEKRSQDWELLNYQTHQQLQRFCRDLNKVYQYYTCLYQDDLDYHSFSWILKDYPDGVFGIVRENHHEMICLLFNFSLETRVYRYCNDAVAKTILNTNDTIYGGEIEFLNQKNYANHDIIVLEKSSALMLNIQKEGGKYEEDHPIFFKTW